jgi:hypothetical protein
MNIYLLGEVTHKCWYGPESPWEAVLDGLPTVLAEEGELKWLSYK